MEAFHGEMIIEEMLCRYCALSVISENDTMVGPSSILRGMKYEMGERRLILLDRKKY